MVRLMCWLDQAVVPENLLDACPGVAVEVFGIQGSLYNWLPQAKGVSSICGGPHPTR